MKKKKVMLLISSDLLQWKEKIEREEWFFSQLLCKGNVWRKRSALEETLITLNSKNQYTSRAKMKLACNLRYLKPRVSQINIQRQKMLYQKQVTSLPLIRIIFPAYFFPLYFTWTMSFSLYFSSIMCRVCKTVLSLLESHSTMHTFSLKIKWIFTNSEAKKPLHKIQTRSKHTISPAWWRDHGWRAGGGERERPWTKCSV